jgi:hypothetical protein
MKAEHKGRTMNASVLDVAASAAPTKPGTQFQGGFYAGRFRIGQNHFALVVSPRTAGDRAPGVWSSDYTKMSGTGSFSDGLANTRAMAEAKLELAQWALGLSIDGYADWYLPSRDELEICYRHLKPTEEENYTWRSGENSSALPLATYAYSETEPSQTGVELLRAGGAEAFHETWYWTSTQYSADGAWGQRFDDGYQGGHCKDHELRARAVRRFLIIQ